MEFGFGVPSRGPLASLENLVALAQKGEELGFDIISVSDHVVVPNSIDSTYPYNETGEFTQLGRRRVHGAADHHRLPCGRDLFDQAADLGYGAAAPQSRPDGEDACDDRRALPGQIDRRLWSRLDEGGVRGDRRAAVRRAGERSATSTSASSRSFGPAMIRPSTATIAVSRTSVSPPSPCSSLTRHCG